MNRVLDKNVEHKHLVTSGRCLFLPRASKTELEWSSGWGDNSLATAPLAQRSDALGYLPLNLSELRPARSPVDALIAYQNFVLPFFTGVDVAMVADIVEAETDAFRRFNVTLGKLIRELPEATTPADVEGLFDEVRIGVEAVEHDARRLSNLRALQYADVGFFGLSLTIATVVGELAAAGVVGVLGAATLRDLLQKYAEASAVRASLQASDFYLPYLLAQAASPSTDAS